MFKIGDKFYSYKQFEEKLKEYEKAVLNKYWVRDSLTLKTQARRFPDSQAAHANPKLKYSHVRIACILGGREHAVMGTKRQSIRQGCQAGMLIRLSKCGKYLELMNLNEIHNHFHPDHLLNFAEEVKTEAAKFSVTLDDLIHLGVKPDMKREFYECVEILKNEHNCDVNILCDEEDNVLCFYLQNHEMKLMFDAFPEIIFIDGTNSLQETGTTYLIMVEDSEGNGSVVAVAVMLQIDADVIDWFITQFEESNPNSEEIKVIMSDRNCVVGASFGTKFSEAALQTPLYHTLKYFNTELNPQHLNVTNKDCESARKFLKNLANAVSEEVYEEELVKLNTSLPQSVMNYYEKNWHPIRDQWVLYRTINYRLLVNQSSNKVENVRQKFKSVILKFTNLEEFIKMFFICVDSTKVKYNPNTTSTEADVSNAPEDKYKRYLTNYSYEKVSQELKHTNDCSNFQIVEIDRCFAPTNEGILEVRYNSCNCLFWTSMQLPCRHIFKFRSVSYLPLFEEELCEERWSQKYLLGLHSSFDAQEVPPGEEAVRASKEDRVLSKEKKIEMMNDVGESIARMSSEVPGRIYYKRLNYLKRLQIKWGNQDGVELGKEDDTEFIFGIDCEDGENDDFDYVEVNGQSFDHNVINRKRPKVG